MLTQDKKKNRIQGIVKDTIEEFSKVKNTIIKKNIGGNKQLIPKKRGRKKKKSDL